MWQWQGLAAQVDSMTNIMHENSSLYEEVEDVGCGMLKGMWYKKTRS
jgi:hypothetical protein